jgi:hypothetical protein
LDYVIPNLDYVIDTQPSKVVDLRALASARIVVENMVVLMLNQEANGIYLRADSYEEVLCRFVIFIVILISLSLFVGLAGRGVGQRDKCRQYTCQAENAHLAIYV